MPQTEAWTIGRLLEWTQKYLADHGADSPRLDAEILLAEALGCRRIELYTTFHEIPKDDARAAFRELVRRRAEGTPVAYLVGRREFFSLSFRVTPDVLIPRPETEFVVLATLDLLKHHFGSDASVRIVDVGTGSGCIAVALAKHVPKGQLTAIDVSKAAIDVAADNVKAHQLSERVKLVESDLLSALPPDAQFEFVVSNPPYVAQGELAQMPRDVTKYEPHLALVAGEQGTEFYQRLIPQAAARLVPGGYLILETSPQLVERLVALVQQEPQLELESTTKDLAGLPRVVAARRK